MTTRNRISSDTPCPNNERQTHHADHNTATEDSYSHENPSLPSGDRRNHHINPGYATSNFARSNVKRLLNAYRLFAPVCIGGPSSTSLEKNDADASASNAAQSFSSHSGMDGHSGRQLPIGMLPRVDFAHKLTNLLQPPPATAAAAVAAAAAAAAAAASERQGRHHLPPAAVGPPPPPPPPPSHPVAGHPPPPPPPPGSMPPNMYSSAADAAAAAQLAAAAQVQHQRLYCQLYDRMRAVSLNLAAAAANDTARRNAVAAAAAAAAAAHSGGRQGVAVGGSLGGSGAGDVGASATIKRRSSNRGGGNHLSGERIRQLREEQKQRAAAVSGGGGLTLPSSSMPVTSISPNALRTRRLSSRSPHPSPISNGHAHSPPSSSPSSPPALSILHRRPRHHSASSAIAEAAAERNVAADCGGAGSERRDSTSAQPQHSPMLLIRDLTHSELQDATLNGEAIPAFSVGGELRLCLPQILRQTLAQFHWQQICRACEELQIHCAPCSSSQLVALKNAGVLPVAAHQCGLITKSDAERLTSYLMIQNSQARVEAAEATTEDDRALPSPSPAKRPKEYGASQTPDAAAASLSTAAERPLDCAAENSVILRVKHECFGLARGTMSADDYAAPNSKCIKCSECERLLDPQEFILHLHVDRRENRTCHWGFDPAHWRTYLHLDEEAYRWEDKRAEATRRLEEVKRRGMAHPKLKRKQSGPESASLHAECSTSTATAHAAASDEEHLLLKKPKLELSPQTPHDDHGDRGGQVDNNNVSPGSAFRPWNADEEGGSAAHPGHEGLHNGDVAERKLDPYLLREIRNRDLTHTDYICEIRTALNCERGLTSANRATVFDALDRLHERLREAEESRDVVVGQVKELKQQCQRLEDELSKKRDELRDLLLMPVSKKVLPVAMPVVDLRRKEAPAEREDKTAAGPSGPSGPSSSAGPTPAACPSPLNLSAESGIDNAERSSSVDSALSKDSEDIRERMRSMEAELKTLRQEVASRNEKAGNNNVGSSGVAVAAVGDSSSSDDVTNSQSQSGGGEIKFDDDEDGKNEDSGKPGSTLKLEESEDVVRPSEAEKEEEEDGKPEAKVGLAKSSEGKGSPGPDEQKVKVSTNNNKESKMTTKRRRIK